MVGDLRGALAHAAIKIGQTAAAEQRTPIPPFSAGLADRGSASRLRKGQIVEQVGVLQQPLP